MRMSDADEFAKAGAETRIMSLARQLGEIDPVTRKYFLRQPAGAAAAILPHVLENVRHLQPLRKRGRDGGQGGTVPGNLRRIIAKQFSEHFSDHTCNVVTIVIQVSRPGETLVACT